MATLIVSAPGKVILHGEHAVVFGKAALATSVDLRCYAIVSQTSDATVTLDLPDFNHHIQWSVLTVTHCNDYSDDSLMVHLRELSGTNSESPSTQNTATLVFLYLLTHIFTREKLKECKGLHVTVLSTLPASAGLGSSAAFSVSLAACLLSLVGSISSIKPLLHSQQKGEHNTPTEQDGTLSRKNVALPQTVLERLDKVGVSVSSSDSISTEWSAHELDIINDWGLKAEKLIHGTPSGIDNSVSTFGGAIHYCSGKIRHLQRMPKLRILLVNTKVFRTTKKMVAGVRDLHAKYPSVVNSVLDSIEAITEKAELLLDKLATLSSFAQDTQTASGEATTIHASLQEVCTMNQHLLNAVGVGHAALDQVCALAREKGLAAKLTGAGGGGCAIILIPPVFSAVELAEVEQAFTKAGFDCWETTIGSVGVTAHQIAILR